MSRSELFARKEHSPKIMHPNAWLWEPLESDPTFVLRAMFGGKAVYLDGQLMLYFTAPHWDDEDWRGICVATSHEHHASLMAEFPELTPHPVLSKWLYLRESEERFEKNAMRLVEFSRRRDSRIGVMPKPRRASIPRVKKNRTTGF